MSCLLLTVAFGVVSRLALSNDLEHHDISKRYAEVGAHGVDARSQEFHHSREDHIGKKLIRDQTGSLLVQHPPSDLQLGDRSGASNEFEGLAGSRAGAPGNPGGMGPRGYPGPRGPRGIQGLKGEQGPRGHQGERGKRGPHGALGASQKKAEGYLGATKVMVFSMLLMNLILCALVFYGLRFYKQKQDEMKGKAVDIAWDGEEDLNAARDGEEDLNAARDGEDEEGWEEEGSQQK